MALISDTNIWRKQFVHIYFQNNICLLEVSFRHKRGLGESRYLDFFLTWSIYSPFIEAPVNLFWTLTILLAKMFFLKIITRFFWSKISKSFYFFGGKISKSFYFFGGFIEWKTSVYFSTLYFSNPIDRPS